MSDYLADVNPENLANVVRSLQREVEALKRRPIQGVEKLNEISETLEPLTEFEFRSHLDPDDPHEPGEGFSGVRIRGEGMDYGGVMSAIACILNDALGLGLTLDGMGVFAGGAATIGALGILVEGLNYIYRHTATNGATTRVGKMSMTLEDGGAVPVMAFDLIAEAGAELLLNPGAEMGDFTNWTKTTETNGAWSVVTGTPSPQAGTYCFKWTPTNATNSGVLTSDRMAASAALDYLASGYIREYLAGGGNPTGSIKVEIKWYNHASAGSLLRTDLLYYKNCNSFFAWSSAEKTFEAPATTLSASVVFTATNVYYVAGVGVMAAAFDTFSFSLAAVAQRLWLSDDGVKCSNGLYPKRAFMFFSSAISNTTMAKELIASTTHAFGVGWYTSGVNANNGDTYTLSCILQKGTYTIATYGVTYSTYGMFDYYIDNVLVASGQNWYSAGSVYNVLKTITNVSVTYDGYHVLKMVVNGKTGSDYACEFTYIEMYQAAD